MAVNKWINESIGITTRQMSDWQEFRLMREIWSPATQNHLPTRDDRRRHFPRCKIENSKFEFLLNFKFNFKFLFILKFSLFKCRQWLSIFTRIATEINSGFQSFTAIYSHLQPLASGSIQLAIGLIVTNFFITADPTTPGNEPLGELAHR